MYRTKLEGDQECLLVEGFELLESFETSELSNLTISSVTVVFSAWFGESSF